jgi:hypothetical protein
LIGQAPESLKGAQHPVLLGRPIHSKPKRVFVTALAVLGFAIWFGFIALFEHYSATRPNRPDATSGRVYQLNNHGSYTYLTKSEQWRLRCLEFGALPFFLAAVELRRFWSRPLQDYDKIRATYDSDKKDADET